MAPSTPHTSTIATSKTVGYRGSNGSIARRGGRTIDRQTPRGRRLAGTGTDRIILARPDGHAAYIGPPDDLTALGEYLDRWYVPSA